MTEFASLNAQDVHEHWDHEARDFTPWLASEIEAEDPSGLENVLGLDIEVVEREKRVGRYNVDILARVVDDDRKVVIENQLNGSDHDHLGKAIAYAAGLDADIIVWIAPQFNDEHRDAVQWLNENSREGVDLFAIRLEVWRIEDSPPAVQLNPVEEPSEWMEKAKRSRGELSETKQLQEEFWTGFRDRIREADSPLQPRKPRPSHYYSNPIGISEYHISFGIYTQEIELTLDLIIEDDEEAFWALHSSQTEIEEAIGAELEWEEPRETRGGNMRSNIRISRDADLEAQDEWEDYYDWMFEYGGRFHDVFPDRIRNIV